MAAIRETFEESGILLAKNLRTGKLFTEISDEEREEGRKAVHAGTILFPDLLEKWGCEADTDSLLLFTRWITPRNVPKRFTTQMYLYFLPLGSVSPTKRAATSIGTPPSSGLGEEDEIVIPNPTHDGGIEHTAARFLPPNKWIDLARQNRIILYPPQFFLTYILSEYLSPTVTSPSSPIPSIEELQHERSRLVGFLSKKGVHNSEAVDTFGEAVVSPVVLGKGDYGESKQDGVGKVDKDTAVLVLDSPGPELSREGIRGSMKRWVITTKFKKEGPRDVNVWERDEILGPLRKQYRNDKSNNREALEESIRLGKEAVDQCGNRSAAIQATRWYGLGHGLQLRYLDTGSGSMKDIDAAIQYKQHSLEIMPPDTSASVRSRRMAGTGRAYGWRYQEAIKGHGNFDADFIAARDHFTDAIEALDEDEDFRCDVLDDLGILHRDRYHETVKWKDSAGISNLHSSISYFEEALSNVPQTSDRRNVLAMLENKLASVLGDLGQAIKLEAGAEPGLSYIARRCLTLARSALDNTPLSHHSRAERLYNLALSYQDAYLWSRKSNTSDLEEAAKLHEEALTHNKSPTFHRMRAGRQAMDASIELEKWSKAVVILEDLLELLLRLTPRTHSDEDLERILRQFSGLGAIAASVFIKAGKSDLEALQILEKGTSLIDGLAMEIKTHEPLPRSNHSTILSRYTELQESISSIRADRDEENASNDGKPLQEYAAESLKLRSACDAFESLQMEMRRLPEFQGIERIPSEEQLLDLASKGPIVCFNVTYLCSHAFIITNTRIRAIELGKDLTPKTVDQCIKAIVSDYGSSRAKPISFTQNGITQLAPSTTETSNIEAKMAWLWKEAVKPILQDLGLFWQHQPPPELPSIWWVGGGLLGLVPIHAAGVHDANSTENTLSHVISSYMPSLKALQFSRKKAWTSLKASERNEKPKVVVVAMPTTPGLGLGPLNTKNEIGSIKQHVGEAADIKVLLTPGKTEALQMIQGCSILHLACHAELGKTSSFQSNLILGSGLQQERLSVDDIRSINLQSAQIAYLSACSTATSSDQALINESIHLAGAFQLAFRHVIGTLWDTFDDAAVKVAGKFYAKLLQDGGTGGVSHALHHAIYEYRGELGDSRKILHWGAFMHVGP
ncbi:hypothetical protein N0V90_005003 [Kalmusia sp. IMI 367209]|nr:hypothetical protein N0V90_005003 [Kalmusia sp. IMI 367209]